MTYENEKALIMTEERDKFSQTVSLIMLRFISVSFLAISIVLLYQRNNLDQKNRELRMKVAVAEASMKICTKIIQQYEDDSRNPPVTQ